MSVATRNNIQNVVSEAHDTFQSGSSHLATDINLSWAKKFTLLKGFVREAIVVSLLNPIDYTTYQFIEIKHNITITARIFTRMEFLTSVNT